MSSYLFDAVLLVGRKCLCVVYDAIYDTLPGDPRVPKLDDTVSGKGHLEKMHRLDREGHERLKGVESKYTP